MDETRARELLTAERERLLRLREREQAHLEESQEDSTGELTTFDQHPGDVATETFEREKDQSVLEQLEAELDEIDEAFTRLEEGRYGICEGTGERIPDERLQAMPAARYTVEYQAQVDRTAAAERARG